MNESADCRHEQLQSPLSQTLLSLDPRRTSTLERTYFSGFTRRETEAERLKNVPKITHWETMELGFYPRQSDTTAHSNRLFFPQLGSQEERGIMFT